VAVALAMPVLIVSERLVTWAAEAVPPFSIGVRLLATISKTSNTKSVRRISTNVSL
jgi:hypothetical protein